jgi:hypothetical protein
MLGAILVSMTGMALPVLAGIWLMPRCESQALIAAPQIWSQIGRSQWLRQGRLYLGSLSAAVRQRHLPGSIAHSSAGRAG